jgi:hypothetical protein
MQTIISRALSELGITPMPSRRCFALMSEWGGSEDWTAPQRKERAGGCKQGKLCFPGRAGGQLSAVCRPVTHQEPPQRTDAAGTCDADPRDQLAAHQHPHCCHLFLLATKP